jgi:hypothetical protein
MAVKTSRSAVTWRRLRRRGVATLDYVLVLGAALPMMAMSYYYSVKIIRAVYQMTCALVCWPFM